MICSINTKTCKIQGYDEGECRVLHTTLRRIENDNDKEKNAEEESSKEVTKSPLIRI